MKIIVLQTMIFYLRNFTMICFGFNTIFYSLFPNKSQAVLLLRSHYQALTFVSH